MDAAKFDSVITTNLRGPFLGRKHSTTSHPDDMARAVLFLLSDEARWTTGCIFPCEGGMSAR